MADITTILALTLLVLSGIIIISFRVGDVRGFPHAKPTTIAVAVDRNHSGDFFLAYAVLNNRSRRAFFNHAVEEAGEW